jgi:sugar phosphate isomerase/epimerase
MYWPDCMRDNDLLERTIVPLSQRGDIERIDCCLPFDQSRRDRLIPILRSCGKEISYAVHAFPADKLSLGSTSDSEQGLARLLFENQIAVAAATGAQTVMFSSGLDPGDLDREPAREAFADFCRWFCTALKPHGMTALLEPFDRTVHRKFLYGPTDESVEFIEALAPEIDNLKLELDMAHVALMGETFEGAIRTAGDLLQHVHLGNCVKRDTSNPFFGDTHPPIGYPGGEIDVPQLVEILAALLNSGYLDKESRGSLVIEERPLPGESAELTIEEGLQKLEEAWKSL